MQAIRIHRHTAGPQGALVNAYLVETGEGIVAVDGTLTVSDGRALRAQLEALAKPLLAVIVTHAHPDHYGGIVEVVADDDTPVIATDGVNAVIRRDDGVKEHDPAAHVRDEWPRDANVPQPHRLGRRDARASAARPSPSSTSDPANRHTTASGCSETTGARCSLGDQVYDHIHATSPTDSTSNGSLNLDRLEHDLPSDATLHIGHGGPVTPAHFSWQREYVETFLDAVRTADWTQPDVARRPVVERMQRFLPTDELQFLMELSIEPVATKLGLLSAEA